VYGFSGYKIKKNLISRLFVNKKSKVSTIFKKLAIKQVGLLGQPAGEALSIVVVWSIV